MANEVLTNSLQDNLTYIKTVLRNCDDIVYRPFSTTGGIEGIVIYSEIMADAHYISETLLSELFALSLPPNPELWPAAVKAKLPFLPANFYTAWKELLSKLLAGDTVILLDQSSQGYVATTADIKTRPIDKPDTELVVRGPLEGYAEKLGPNLALVRNRLKNPSLKIVYYTLGSESQTGTALLYLDGVIKPEILNEIRTRIESVNLRSIQDSGYLNEFLCQCTWSIFPMVQSTERPDKTTAALMEGGAAVLVDGSPFALLVPVVFWSFFQTPEDYTQHFIVGTALRLLRFLSFLSASALPALYVAGTVFHPEMIPLRLLFSLTSARENVPLPAVLEVTVMLLILDIFREATLRVSRTVGPAIGIVGALVMGEAAVSAGVISPIMVIIISLTAVATFAIPTEDLRGTARIISYILLILSALLGLYGFLLGASAILLHAASLESLGIPYLSPVATFRLKELSDTFMRAPWIMLQRKPQQLSGANPARERRFKP